MSHAKSPASHPLKAWLEGKPFLSGMFALEVASAAETIFLGMEMLRKGERNPRVPAPPPIRDWTSLYRDHERVYNAIGSLFGLPREGLLSASAIAGYLRVLQKTAPLINPQLVAGVFATLPQPMVMGLGAEIHSGLNTIRQKYLRHVEEFVLENEKYDDAKMEVMVSMPEVQFFMFVWMPCWIRFRVYPGKLFHQARTGDTVALEKLVWIDKTVLHDRMIAEEMHRAHRKVGHGGVRRVGKAMGSGFKGRFTKRQFKHALGGLIQEVSVSLKQPLGAADIRSLFDAIARVQGKLSDRDLPERPDAFEQAMRRQRGTWPSFGKREDKGNKSRA